MVRHRHRNYTLGERHPRLLALHLRVLRALLGTPDCDRISAIYRRFHRRRRRPNYWLVRLTPSGAH